MKKYFLVLMMLTISFSLVSCKTPDEENDPPTDIIDHPDEANNKVELINDRTFSKGFNVLGYSPVVDGRNIIFDMDYNNTTSDSDPLWYMAQWWTPYNVKDSIYKYENGKHIYKTKSRTIEINPDDNGYLRFELLGSEEYKGGTREMNEPWPHLLIEQNFTESVKITDLKELNVSLEFTVEKSIDMNGDKYNPTMHAAQYLWYFTLRNNLKNNESFEEAGQNGDFLWFGIPLYDNRSDFIAQSAHIDGGAPGTTGKLIYSISSRNYFNEKIQMGKTYNINIDILPYLKEAFIYAINNGVLVNCLYQNMEVGYLNFGWELPGSFDVASTIRGMSAEAIFK